MAQQAGWRIDVNQCISCRACEMACKAEYGLQAGQGRRRRVIERTRVESGVTRTYFVSVSCHQCKFPACKAACPMSKKLNSDGSVSAVDTPAVSALYKDVGGTYTGAKTAGVVLHNPDNCIGCRKCEWACPYGAPQYNPQTRKVHKCELCWQRVTNTALSSERQRPACEGTCLGGSIIFAPANAANANDPDTSPSAGFNHYGSNSTTMIGGVNTAGTDHAIDVDALASDEWARPGEAPSDPGYSEGRGSDESASYTLTLPAIRFRTRVYQTRGGGVA